MLYLCLLLTVVSAYSPLDNSEENMARTFGVLTAQVRDSFLYPLILNPLDVNMLTCGSVLTLYENISSYKFVIYTIKEEWDYSNIELGKSDWATIFNDKS